MHNLYLASVTYALELKVFPFPLFYSTRLDSSLLVAVIV